MRARSSLGGVAKLESALHRAAAACHAHRGVWICHSYGSLLNVFEHSWLVEGVFIDQQFAPVSMRLLSIWPR